MEILSILTRKGINVDIETAEVMLAAIQKWLPTRNGINYVADTLEIEFEKGRSDYKYLLQQYNADPKEVKPDSVTFIKAVSVNGEIIASHRLRVLEKGRSSCEFCGVHQHCVTEILDKRTGEVISACNHCCVFNDDPVIKAEGDHNVCGNCLIVECAYHPMRDVLRNGE